MSVLVELEADAAREECHGQLVEADALARGLRGELGVQARRHAHEVFPTGLHSANSIACDIDMLGIGCDTTPMCTRTAKQQARFDAATRRAQEAAIDRHRRIEGARIAKLERQITDNFIGDIATYAGAKA